MTKFTRYNENSEFEGNVGIGITGLTSKLQIRGVDNTLNNYGLLVEDSGGTTTFRVRNDGVTEVNGGNGIGSSFSIKQNSFTSPYVIDVYNANQTIQLLASYDNGSSGWVRFAGGAVNINQYSNRIEFGPVYGGFSSVVRVNADGANQDTFVVGDASFGGGAHYLSFDSNNQPHYYLQTSALTTTVKINSTGDSYFNGGNVGLGTASPSANVHIVGVDATSSNYGLKVNDSTNSPLFYVRNDGNISIGTSSSTAKVLIMGVDDSNSNYSLRLQNSGATDLLLVRNDGKISINNSSIVYTVNISGTTQTRGWWSRGFNRIEYGNNEAQPSDSRPNIEWNNSSDSAVFISGIKNDDTWGLYCKGASDYGFEIDRVTRNIGLSTSPSSTTKLLVRGIGATSATNALTVINTASTTNFIVRDDGNVGINTTAPNLKLDVNGDIGHRGSTPSSFNASQNDFPTSGTSYLRLENTDVTAVDVTGFANGYDGKRLVVSCIPTSTGINLKNQDAGSLAANRMEIYNYNIGGGFADWFLAPGDVVEFIYDGVDSVWRKIN